MLNDFKYVFVFIEQTDLFKDFYHWMRINKIDEVYPKLEKDGINTFEKFL